MTNNKLNQKKESLTSTKRNQSINNKIQTNKQIMSNTRNQHTLVVFCYSTHTVVSIDHGYKTTILGIFTKYTMMLKLVRSLSTFKPDVRGCDVTKLILS